MRRTLISRSHCAPVLLATGLASGEDPEVACWACSRRIRGTQNAAGRAGDELRGRADAWANSRDARQQYLGLTDNIRSWGA